jgi:hypothetical protein
MSRTLADPILIALETLREVGLMTPGELAEATDLTVDELRNRLWQHMQRGRIELLYGLTREGQDFIAEQRRLVDRRRALKAFEKAPTSARRRVTK